VGLALAAHSSVALLKEEISNNKFPVVVV
jgi:hypothetical protein